MLLLLQLKPGMKHQDTKRNVLWSLTTSRAWNLWKFRKKNSLSILNQAYGLIEQGSGVKTIMVLSVTTLHSLQIHRQTHMISWTWLSSRLKALLAEPRWASDFSSSKLKSVVFFSRSVSAFSFSFFFLLRQCSSLILAKPHLALGAAVLYSALKHLARTPASCLWLLLCLLVPLRAETSQSVESEKWSIDYAARSLKGTPDHWAMTARGHRLQKGPVHGEVSLQKGNAALFMSLYYVIAESFFIRTEIRTNRWYKKKKRKKKRRYQDEGGMWMRLHEWRVWMGEDVGAEPACGGRFPECRRGADSSPLLRPEN